LQYFPFFLVQKAAYFDVVDDGLRSFVGSGIETNASGTQQGGTAKNRISHLIGWE